MATGTDFAGTPATPMGANALAITTGIFMQFDVPAIGDMTVESICNHSI